MCAIGMNMFRLIYWLYIVRSGRACRIPAFTPMRVCPRELAFDTVDSTIDGWAPM